MGKTHLKEMSLGDHIEELRARVIRGLLFLALTIGVTLFFQDQLMWIVVQPHARTMEKVVMSRPKDPHLEHLSHLAQTLQKNFLDSKKDKKSLHLSKKEQHLAKAIVDVVHYLEWQEKKLQKSATKLKILKYQSGFMAYLKVCFIVGLFFGAPFFLYQLWLFVEAGLYDHEKKYVKIFAPVSFISFFVGVAFGYFVLIPIGLQYLSTFASPEIAENFISIDWYLSLFFALTIALGVLFELPLFMLFLSKLGIFTWKTYFEQWKYWILISTILGAVLTPPDPVTQILMATPMVFLYGFGILLSYLFGTSNKAEEYETPFPFEDTF